MSEFGSSREAIIAALRQLGRDHLFDPRHVEAYVCEEYGAIEGLSLAELIQSVRGACDLIGKDGFGFAEFVAKRRGL